MQIYPNPSQCPENVYNLWRPFAMELLKTPYEKDIVGLEIMLKHIYILCNNEKACYDYFIGWIAMMIQHPEVKTTCITLISLEGAGKGTLMDSFSKMMGASKVLETKDPSRDVWGPFNGVMTDAFLVNLNEMEMTDTKQAEGKIKALITDSQMTINLKGVNQFQIESCHHFIVTTNKENGGMTTKKDDRRKLIIRSSDELIGNKKYFDKIYQLLSRVETIRTYYDYFKNYDLQNYNHKDIPATEYQNDLKELSVSAPEMWLEAFTRATVPNVIDGADSVEMLGKKVFELFVTWKNENNVRYETTPIALGMKLKNLKIDGVSKGKDIAFGKTKQFDFIKFRKYFNIGCLIDLNAEEDEKTPSYDAVLENNCNSGFQPDYNSDEYEFVEED
jgi:hypothetical protein